MSATQVVKKSLNMNDIRKKATALGIAPGKMKKGDLIHAIQIAEGYTPCYGKSNGRCPYTDCCFLSDCIKARA
jgi:hypothetical protein